MFSSFWHNATISSIHFIFPPPFLHSEKESFKSARNLFHHSSIILNIFRSVFLKLQHVTILMNYCFEQFIFIPERIGEQVYPANIPRV